ncbi:hypothetical protein [Trichlorobacter lovleyi]|uniref:hypothetical protein n=1 Tax=Trichlorobacter lovleyi TaxID=313985 RepID=UPI003D0F692F
MLAFKKMVQCGVLLHLLLLPIVSFADDKNQGPIVVISTGEPSWFFVSSWTRAEEPCTKIAVEARNSDFNDMLYNSLWRRDVDKYIAVATSKISIYEAHEGMLQGCRTPKDWGRYSEIVPATGEPVISFSARCTIKKTDNSSSVYIIFQEKLGDILNSGDRIIVKKYMPLSSWHAKPKAKEPSSKSFSNYMVGNYSYTAPTCLEVEVNGQHRK